MAIPAEVDVSSGSESTVSVFGFDGRAACVVVTNRSLVDSAWVDRSSKPSGLPPGLEQPWQNSCFTVSSRLSSTGPERQTGSLRKVVVSDDSGSD